MNKMKTTFRAEIILIFSKDICENELLSVLSIKEYIFKQKSQNRLNPITKEKNDGYWRYNFSEIESYDSDDIQNEILYILNKHRDEFKQVIETFESKVIVRIFANVREEYPALMFENEFLKSIGDLKATLDIVVNS